MEEIIVKFRNENKDLILSHYLLFEYRVKEEIKGRFYSKFIFVRDDNKPYIEELKKIEKEYQPFKYFPLYLTIGLSIAAFIIVTALLILFFTGNSVVKQLWYAFIIPAGILLVIAVAISFIRLKQVDKIIDKKRERDKEISQKIKNIKGK